MEDDVRAVLDAFDAAFAAGDAEALSGMFAPDASLLLLFGEPFDGRDAIHAHWTRVFEAWDTSAWHAERVVVDVHGDRAYAYSTYTETLRARDGSASIEVWGRLIQFLRREPDGTWLVTLAMNSHRRPQERRDGPQPD